jgi:hypothetical protein
MNNSINKGVGTPAPIILNSMKITAKRKRKPAVSTGTERICSHDVEWRLEGNGLQLLDIDVEHIQNSLIENYMQGELCTIAPNGRTVWGWWNIQM